MKTISKKVWIACGAIIAAMTVVIAVMMVSGNKKEAYRSILIYDITGEAVLSRDGVGDMNAYENLLLQSGDRLSVGKDSSVRLKLDGDKYILAEPETVFVVVAEGDDKNSKTSIELQQGAITNEIQNQLSADSGYEVTTPNSVMAVRGTVFRVALENDENGDTSTRVSTFEGRVSSRLIQSDGIIADEEVEIASGKELKINGNAQESVYMSEPEDIDFSTIPQFTLQMLQEISNHGRDLCISPEEIEALVEAALEDGVKTEEPKESQSEDAESESADSQEDRSESSESENVGLQGTRPKDSESESARPQGTQSISGGSGNSGTQKNPPSESSTEDSGAQENPPVVSSTEDSGMQENPPAGNDAENGGAQENPPIESNTENNGTQENPPSVNDTENNGSQNHRPGWEEEVKPEYYTVTFMYGDHVFGTQRVAEGSKAERPSLRPAAEGAWDYDFTKEIHADTVIQWR